jgi:hypothetical protein
LCELGDVGLLLEGDGWFLDLLIEPSDTETLLASYASQECCVTFFDLINSGASLETLCWVRAETG